MIKKALSYPFVDEDWAEKMILGSVMMVSTLLVIPLFTFLGYLLRLMREDSMPRFSNLLEMTVEGFKASLVVLLYVGVPMTLVFIFETGFVTYAALLLLSLSVYLMYSVLYQFSNKGWRSSFSLQVLENVFSIQYLIGWLAAIIILSIIGILYAFSLLLLVTIILYPAVYFYQTVLAYRIMTKAIESQ
jgi:hypothetical protein